MKQGGVYKAGLGMKNHRIFFRKIFNLLKGFRIQTEGMKDFCFFLLHCSYYCCNNYYMVNNMKTKHVGLRIDPKSREVLEEAHGLSGIPLSEIARRGAVQEALKIISMFSRKSPHVRTNSQEEK